MSVNKMAQSKVHLIGVGGIGMSGIAEILLGLGAKVSGSDVKKSERTDYLENLGAQIFIGHEGKNLADADVVVRSSAIGPENPELEEARSKRIPVISRAEALAELMRSKRGVAIAGTHGKTTTTSMIAQVFDYSSKNPTIVSGGIVLKFGTNAKLGTGEWFIAEADESDGSFEKLSPEISVITNMDNDHLDHYGSFESVAEAFKKFAEKIPFYGTLVYCGDDADCAEAFANFSKKSISYGFGEHNDFYITEVSRGEFKITHQQDEVVGVIKPALPGNYNALNSLAAVVVSLRAGIPFDVVKEGIEAFSGVRRRFELKADFEKEDVRVLDDYAHHPTEITAVLSACKGAFLGSRIRCVFQPHRYSRFKNCWDQFQNAFDLADEVYVLNVYPAGEKPIKGYESKDFHKVLTNNRVHYIEGDFEQAANEIKKDTRSGDVIITVGAGDVYKLGELFISKFRV